MREEGVISIRFNCTRLFLDNWLINKLWSKVNAQEVPTAHAWIYLPVPINVLLGKAKLQLQLFTHRHTKNCETQLQP